MKSNKLLVISIPLLLAFAFSNCTKDNNTASTTSDALIRNNWNVNYYFNSQDLTSNYNGYQILFSNTGLLVAQKNNQPITGSWNTTMDSKNNEQVNLNFTTSDANLLQLNHDWTITNKTSTTIEFESSENSSPLETLRISKQ